jgi:hypothetical protein
MMKKLLLSALVAGSLSAQAQEAKENPAPLRNFGIKNVTTLVESKETDPHYIISPSENPSYYIQTNVDITKNTTGTITGVYSEGGDVFWAAETNTQFLEWLSFRALFIDMINSEKPSMLLLQTTEKINKYLSLEQAIVQNTQGENTEHLALIFEKNIQKALQLRVRIVSLLEEWKQKQTIAQMSIQKEFSNEWKLKIMNQINFSKKENIANITVYKAFPIKKKKQKRHH